MMYVDPSKVEMALRYAGLAGSPTAVLLTEDVEVFLRALRADATARGLSRYKAVLANQPGSLPWSAFSRPALPIPGSDGLPELSGPAVVELLAGQVDPEDEGLSDFRLPKGNARAKAILNALYSFDEDFLLSMSSPAGWRLQAADEPGELGVDRTGEDMGPEPGPKVEPDAGEDPSPTGDEQPPASEEPPPASEEPAPASEPAPRVTPSKSRQAVAVAGVAAGFVVLGIAAWRLG